MNRLLAEQQRTTEIALARNNMSPKEMWEAFNKTSPAFKGFIDLLAGAFLLLGVFAVVSGGYQGLPHFVLAAVYAGFRLRDVLKKRGQRQQEQLSADRKRELADGRSAALGVAPVAVRSTLEAEAVNDDEAPSR